MNRKIRLTTAQALIRFLNQQYIQIDGKEFPFVEGVFGVFGHGNVLGIGQALEENPGHLKVIQGKNEQGMTHAAVAFSRQKLRQKIFAVTASAGPGSANIITAAATAFANNIPVLILPADTFASRQPDPVLQQLEHETSNATTTNDAFKAVSKYWDRVQRPEQLMSSLLRAFEVMTNPATAGPVTICISQDTEGEAYDYDESFFKKRVHYMDRQLPSQRELIGGVERIKQSKNPVIIVGGGARYSSAGEELMDLSKAYHIPLVETPAGKSTVPSDFENNLGGVGVLGTAGANAVIAQADLIIGVGTRYTDFTTSSKTAFPYDQVKFLNININRMHASKLDAFQMIGDAKEILAVIIPELLGYKTAFNKEIGQLKEAWAVERERLRTIEFTKEDFTPEVSNHFSQAELNEYAKALKTEFTQTSAFITINDEVAEDSNVIGAAGSLPAEMQRLWKSNVPDTYHLEYGYSCMGYEICGALGVKLANPKREVYAMVGDGSFLMLHSELVTAIQYNQKINIMLFDNSGFGSINNLQMNSGGNSYKCEFRDYQNKVMSIDYAKIAEAYGAKAYRATTREELIDALADAKKQTVSTLIEMKVLPKTMTDGYGGWWRVGLSELSKNPKVQTAYKNSQKMIQEQAREY
ncbi:3D-(3,5/4)-trihydroxycyclohexane-1,2-dione acylhydrolase (decyclizing) [Carnobacterium gallinarum]|uniref:3D-(3,5/4)-trihydroxycyclohexane-1,2-dione acylhydrolase (decyclizing) n=1 Tax=Carnobacterium gallinarum TaxID=2749 RepID=UPI00054FC4A6|nr:3D-(3,5/4)-trihydroxycyclohexane-1,2-dione acylhydrolase (decyclizing) [Carnobacterium gallinarum]